jgi:4'-phosphopantetheinyl transferase
MNKNLLSNDFNWKTFNKELRLEKTATHIFCIPVFKHYQQVKRFFTDVLSEREQEKVSRLFNQKDKERYIVSKYCLREILSQFLIKEARDIEFVFSKNRKPRVKNIEFNISHTEDYILIGISPESIGIDVEYINQDYDFKSILNISFSAKEIYFINKGNADPLNFYTLWTRKEALLKAVGEGISDNLHEVESINDIVSRAGETYNIKSFILDKKYVVSLATQINQNQFSFWIWK